MKILFALGGGGGGGERMKDTLQFLIHCSMDIKILFFFVFLS